jgi:hypothetical protein
MLFAAGTAHAQTLSTINGWRFTGPDGSFNGAAHWRNETREFNGLQFAYGAGMQGDVNPNNTFGDQEFLFYRFPTDTRELDARTFGGQWQHQGIVTSTGNSYTERLLYSRVPFGTPEVRMDIQYTLTASGFSFNTTSTVERRFTLTNLTNVDTTLTLFWFSTFMLDFYPEVSGSDNGTDDTWTLFNYTPNTRVRIDGIDERNPGYPGDPQWVEPTIGGTVSVESPFFQNFAMGPTILNEMFDGDVDDLANLGSQVIGQPALIGLQFRIPLAGAARGGHEFSINSTATIVPEPSTLLLAGVPALLLRRPLRRCETPR